MIPKNFRRLWIASLSFLVFDNAVSIVDDNGLFGLVGILRRSHRFEALPSEEIPR